MLFVVCFLYRLCTSLRTFQVMVVSYFKDLGIGMVVTVPWAIPPIGMDFGTTTSMEECSTIGLPQSSMDGLATAVPAATKCEQLPVVAPLCK